MKNMEDKQKLIENATTEELAEALEYMKGKTIINLIYSDERELIKKELKKRRKMKKQKEKQEIKLGPIHCGKGVFHYFLEVDDLKKKEKEEK